MSLFQSIKKLGDEQINALVGKLAENEMFIKLVTRIMTTKESIDKQTDVMLKQANIASQLQVRELKDRVGQLDRQVRKLKKQQEELQKTLDTLQASDAGE